jgi:hypothetical protein
MQEFGHVDKTIEVEDEIIETQYTYFYTDINKLPKNIWLLGKPAGTIFKRNGINNILNVRVTDKLKKQHTASFNINNYNDEKEAYKDAKKYQIETSYKLGLTKNLIRILDDDIIEVKISKNNIMKTDMVFIPLIQKIPIFTSMSGNGMVYSACSVNDINQQFHTLITSFKMVDHINGDTLDNRLENLMYTTPSLNNSNRHNQESNKFGCIGVRLIDTDFGKAFKSSIKMNKKETYKLFYVNTLGYANAKDMAIEFSNKLRKCDKFEDATNITSLDDIKLMKFRLKKINIIKKHLLKHINFNAETYLPIKGLSDDNKTYILFYYISHQFKHYEQCNKNYDTISKILIEKMMGG